MMQNLFLKIIKSSIVNNSSLEITSISKSKSILLWKLIPGLFAKFFVFVLSIINKCFTNKLFITFSIFKAQNKILLLNSKLTFFSIRLVIFYKATFTSKYTYIKQTFLKKIPEIWQNFFHVAFSRSRS